MMLSEDIRFIDIVLRAMRSVRYADAARRLYHGRRLVIHASTPLFFAHDAHAAVHACQR